jgi:hypothetical protein
MVTALDAPLRIDFLDVRYQLAESIIRSALPSVRLPPKVLRRAIDLWPMSKGRERTQAAHALAKALGCDARTLMTMLRQARVRLRDRARNARGY